MAKRLVCSGGPARRGFRLGRLASIAAALVFGWGASALAQPAAAPPVHEPTPEELSTARQLFRRAVELEDAGDWASALATYERVAAVTATPVVLFRIGACNEKLGRSVAALNAYELAVREAERRVQADVLAEARKRASDLAARTPHLVLEPPGDAEGLVIELDGKPIQAALAGTSLLVDPGDHALSVRAQNYASPFEARVSLAERETKTVRISLGDKKVVVAEPAPGPAPEPTPAPPATPPAAVPAPLPAPSPPPSRTPLLVSAISTAALGAAGLATGLVAHDKHGEYEAANASPAPGSLAARTDLRDEGRSFALASTLLTAGALLAGGATAYFYFAPAPASPAPGPPSARALRLPAVSAWVDRDGAGLVARGAL